MSFEQDVIRLEKEMSGLVEKKEKEKEISTLIEAKKIEAFKKENEMSYLIETKKIEVERIEKEISELRKIKREEDERIEKEISELREQKKEIKSENIIKEISDLKKEIKEMKFMLNKENTNSALKFAIEKCTISFKTDKRIKTSVLYDAYVKFCNENKLFAFNPNRFTKELASNLCIEKKVARINNKVENCYVRIDLK